jgi:hypothetical protein
VSIDPLWEKYRSLSPYNYSGNNPVMLKDPSGKAFGPMAQSQDRIKSEGWGYKSERKARSAGDAPHGSSHLEEGFKSSVKNTAELVTKVIPETITQVAVKTYDLASIGYKVLKPDAARVGAGATLITGTGGSASSEYTMMEETRNSSMDAIGSSTTGRGMGVEISAGGYFGLGWFTGANEDMNAQSLSGRGYSGNFGGGVLGALGISISYAPTKNGDWIFIGLTAGVSATEVSANAQVTETVMDKD